MRRTARILALSGVLVLLIALAAAPALATITPVAGNCTGNGNFSPGGFKDAASASVTIPQKATVAWAGTVVKPPPDEPRAVSGFVQLELPMGQKVTLGEWPSTGVLVNNTGSYEYDLPAVIAGFDMTFSGKHFEEGALWCEGTVTIQVEGNNPLGIPAVALLVISVVGVSLSIRQKPGGGPTEVTEYREGDVI